MTESKKTPLSYGLWPSPISAKMVGEGIGLDDVQFDSDGERLVWHERRSAQGVLVTASLDNLAKRDLTVDENVRAFVGYGGGDFHVAKGQVFFAEMDGRIYKRDLKDGFSRPITPAIGKMASPTLSADGRWLMFVFSDGNTDLLGLVDVEGEDWPIKLSKGADFYMQPAWHPSGEMIAWVEWDHPNMPWDQTRIKLGKLAGTPPRLESVETICDLDDLPAVEPLFSPDGKWLSYISSNGEWDRLILRDLQSGEEKKLVEGDKFLIAGPAWVQGRRACGWSHNSKSIFYTRKFGGFTTIWKVDIESGKSTQVDSGDYTNINQLAVSPSADELAFTGSSPKVSSRVVHWKDNSMQVVSRSSGESVPEAYLSDPQPISWRSPEGMEVFANYFPPTNPAFEGQGLPPAIVSCHGGPTGEIPVSYSLQRAFFTSRGYGFLELNYRGSSGYGLTYQRAMRHRWGDVDTIDARDAVKALGDLNLADPKRMVIMGGSAGGYMVLNALVQFPGVYKAGINLFGVSNLFNLAMDTHKFEQFYLDSMVGPLPEAAERYKAWSPIYHVDKIRDPLATFQGSIDPVVPPDQSIDIVKAVKGNGVPHIYVEYEGEGHGFRKTENRINMLQEILKFLRQYVLFG